MNRDVEGPRYQSWEQDWLRGAVVISTSGRSKANDFLDPHPGTSVLDSFRAVADRAEASVDLLTASGCPQIVGHPWTPC